REGHENSQAEDVQGGHSAGAEAAALLREAQRQAQAQGAGGAQAPAPRDEASGRSALASSRVRVAEWIEIIVPATVASADDVAALLAGDVAEAASGTEIRGSEVVVWVPIERLEQARAAIVSAAQRLAAQGLAVNAAGVVAR